MVNTFGAIDWYAYYKKERPTAPMLDLPCQYCELGKKPSCGRMANPDDRRSCQKWCDWCRKWWPGKKKAAPGMTVPESGKGKLNKIIVSEERRKVKYESNDSNENFAQNRDGDQRLHK